MKEIKCSICGKTFKIDEKTFNYLDQNHLAHICDECEDFLMTI